jgi:hypothetical protein
LRVLLASRCELGLSKEKSFGDALVSDEFDEVELEQMEVEGGITVEDLVSSESRSGVSDWASTKRTRAAKEEPRRRRAHC